MVTSRIGRLIVHRAPAGKLTVRDYKKTPEGARFQLVDGEIYEQMDMPVFFHQVVVARLCHRLVSHIEPRSAGAVVAGANVFLSRHDVVIPDVLFVATEHADRIERDGVHGAPDLCVEVLSPSTRRLDLGKKRRPYARHGVAELWIVDPDRATTAVWRFAESRRAPAARLGREDELTTPLLPGLKIRLAEIFA